MFKNVDWAAGAGEVTMGALMPYVTAGKVPGLSTVKDANLMINGAAVLADLLFADKLRGFARGYLNGIGAGGVTLLTQELVNRYALSSSTTTATTAGTTGANAQMFMAPAAPVVSYAPAVSYEQD